MIVIVPYKAEWPPLFARLAAPLRAIVPDAVAIHHIGSTSVPGLAAKDVIDLQLTVGDLDTVPVEAITALGYTFRGALVDHCPPGMSLDPMELAKRYFNRAEPRVHLHVRSEGRFNQQYALLCRDYLRTHPDVAAAYAEVKRQLARYFPDDADGYYAIKDPAFDLFMGGAREWAQVTGWQTPPSDA